MEAEAAGGGAAIRVREAAMRELRPGMGGRSRGSGAAAIHMPKLLAGTGLPPCCPAIRQKRARPDIG